MKEISIDKLNLLHERALQIFEIQRKEDATFDFPMAIILGIFAIFNPENEPMEENLIQEIFSTYLAFAKTKLSLN